MIIVPIEPVQAAIETLSQFNKLDLSQVTLTEAGQPIVVDAKLMEDFDYTGLSNKDFVALEWWKPENHSLTEYPPKGE